MRINFLDVSFDLQSKSNIPFLIPEDTPLFKNIRSNQSSNMHKEIPKMISDRISRTSSVPTKFNKAAQVYNTALKTSGYKKNIEYQKIEAKQKNSRKRNMLWFNLPTVTA